MLSSDEADGDANFEVDRGRGVQDGVMVFVNSVTVTVLVLSSSSSSSLPCPRLAFVLGLSSLRDPVCGLSSEDVVVAAGVVAGELSSDEDEGESSDEVLVEVASGV